MCRPKAIMNHFLLMCTLSFCCTVVALLLPMFSVEGKLSTSDATSTFIKSLMDNHAHDHDSHGGGKGKSI